MKPQYHSTQIIQRCIKQIMATLAIVIGLLTFGSPLHALEVYSTKKGVGNDKADRIAALNVSWYYNWNIQRVGGVDPAIEYVPMKHNQYWRNESELAKIGDFKYFLGFNEPEDANQGNITVATALSQWPNLEVAVAREGLPGAQMGSPVTANPGHAWIVDFMNQANTAGRKVDFMTMHKYPTPTSSASIIDGAKWYHDTYGKDVWITEFNSADWTSPNDYSQADSYTWMTEVLFRLESTDYIKRYAIFPWEGTTSASSCSPVFITDTQGTRLTPLGKLYAEYRSVDINGPYVKTWYHMHNKGSKMHLSSNAGASSMATIHTEGAELEFELVDAGGGNFFIINKASGMRLASDGTTVSWTSSSTGTSALWKLNTHNHNWVKITHVDSSKRLYGLGTGEVGVSTTTTGSRDQWTFVRSGTAHQGTQNYAPVFQQNPISGQSATVGQAYTGSLAAFATDANNDVLSFAKVNGGPAWLSVAANGALTGTPGSSNVGVNNFTVSVSDGTAPAVQASLTITVNPAPIPNRAPVVNAGANQTVDFSGPAAWTPANISPVAWYDASDASSITQSGGLVSQWNDKSGNSNHATQATAGNQPEIGVNTLNGLPLITARNGAKFMSVSGAPSMRMGIAVVNARTTAGGTILNIGSTSSSTHEFFVRNSSAQVSFDGSGNTTGKYSRDGGAFSGYSKDHTVTSSGTHIWSGVFNSSNTLTTILNRPGLNSDAVGHDVAEILWFSSELSTEDLQKVEGYLAHKWGQVGNLPVGHPYKDVPPSQAAGIATLSGSASDADNDPLATVWSVVSGPGSVNFNNASALNTAVSFTESGVYTLRLSANDNNGGQAFDDVVITVSAPVVETTVPNVVGLTQGAAQSSIVAAQLIVGNVTSEYSYSVAAGNVISQSLTAGSSVAIGTSVNLVVSLGVQMVSVPNVVGLAQGAAESNILSAQLTVGNVTTVYSDTVAAGSVISQSLTSGSSVAIGTSVNLVVSLGAPNTAPVAMNGSVTTDEDVAVSVVLIGQDEDGDALTYTVLSSPANGSLTGVAPNLTYTPNQGFFGSDSFTFKASDAEDESNVATVSITVNEVTTSGGVLFTENFESPVVSGYAQGVSPNNGKWIRGVVGFNAGYHGLVNKNGGDFTNSDPNNQQGYSFRYENSGLTSAEGTIGVLQAGVTYTISFDVVKNGFDTGVYYRANLIAFPAGASRTDCRSLPAGSSSLKLFTGNCASDGTTSTVSFEFTPTATHASLIGMDLGIRLGGKYTTDSAIIDNVRISTNGVTISNTAPVANAGSVVTDEDTSAPVTLSASDAENDSISYLVASGPTNGVLTGIAPNLTYTPNAGFFGSDSFTFKVNDGKVDSNIATISITVNEVVPSAKLVRTTISNVSSAAWTTVNLGQTYNSMVVVATPIQPLGTTIPVVTRIRNITATGFDVKLDRADALADPISFDVSVIAVEEGVYTLAEQGVKMEAVKFNSTLTASKSSWVAEARTYQNTYTNPVVVGQVMSANDSKWSAFWSMGSSATNPVSATSLNVGKHVGEDPVKTRANETIGYIVIEAGNGVINGVAYEAAIGTDTILGLTNSTTPYSYNLSGNLTTASAVALSQTGMDGSDGSWAVLSGPSAFSPTQIKLYVSEDKLADSEQSHSNEQVAYIVFE